VVAPMDYESMAYEILRLARSYELRRPAVGGGLGGPGSTKTKAEDAPQDANDKASNHCVNRKLPGFGAKFGRCGGVSILPGLIRLDCQVNCISANGNATQHGGDDGHDEVVVRLAPKWCIGLNCHKRIP